MAKHTDLQVITNNAAALPALAQKIFADWKTFRLLMEQADQIADHYDTMAKIWDELDDYEPSGRGEPPSADYLKLNNHMKYKLARCCAWLDKIDTADLYDIHEHGDRVLRKTIVADRLGMMLSTLVGEPSNPKAALAMMLQHTVDAELSYPALESGCREIEAGAKPFAHRNPGELLKLFTAHEEQWRRRREAITGIEELTEGVLERVPQAQARFALAQAKDKAKSAAWDLTNATSLLRRSETTVDAKQNAVDAANQELEAAIAARTRAKQQFTDAVAAKQAADAALAAALEQQQDAPSPAA